MKKYLIIILVVLLIITLAKRRKTTNIPKPKDTAVSLEQVVSEPATGEKVQAFSISGFSEDGKNRWQVDGESADIFSEIVNMQTIKAKSQSEEVSVTLTADEGTLFRNSNDIELRKNVIVITDEGTTLKADKLKWLAEAERIVTDDYVYIEREDISVSGTVAEVAPNMKKAQLNHDVKMTITSQAKDSDAEASPATVITCDGPLEVDYQNHISYFNKNVIIEDKKGKIFADKVIAYIDPEEKRIYKAIAKGNVKITRQQNVSYSDEAIYLADEGKAILLGSPKVVIYSTEGEGTGL